MFLTFAVSQSVNISDMKCGIPELKGENYKVWKERVLLHLGWMDIDYAIRKPKPPAITETNTPDTVDLYEKWERLNRLFVTFIKTNISAGIRGFVDHVRIWGCPSEVRIYIQQDKKLDLKTISWYFIGYAKKSKGYEFYCLSRNTRIVESRNAKFLENDLISGSDLIQDIGFEKDHYEV
uniref:Retroviral polymerase SH3-like domain-containing protein n=1 Tax=Cajanus cajan TaxID=3821 RepID=A0A151RDP7_CAJCA|nr:hypothetical protein KK1_038124 [Cajanus cajan]